MLALLGVFAASAPASAAEGDPYRISGNVQLDGEPLPGIILVIDGPGGAQEVETDENGQWSVQVPERGDENEYTVTLDENSLPEGIAVVDPEDDTPNVLEAPAGSRRSTSSSERASATSPPSSTSWCSASCRGSASA